MKFFRERWANPWGVYKKVGTDYILPLPIESIIMECLEAILEELLPFDEKAIDMYLYCMNAQIYNDGNKIAPVILVNCYLVLKGTGMLIIPEKVTAIKRLLDAYYEDKDNSETLKFVRIQYA